MQNTKTLHLHIDHDRQGSYFTLPFSVEPGAERLDLNYTYRKDRTSQEGGATRSVQTNIVDLSLCGADGEYLGSSGSDRDHVWVSGYGASDGYTPAPVRPGKWAVVVGAYKIAPEGVDVTYTVTLTMKRKRLFRGDTHIHTTGSDGVLPAAEVARLARRMGLDYIFVTDHNNYAHNYALPREEGLTVLPGTEWTHYRGHAGFLGIVRPFDGSFFTNSKEETARKLHEAREKGAVVVINHPFCPLCPWLWGLDDMEYDAVEIWNGVMSERNVRAIAWWQGQLAKGRRLPAVGGSDYHRPGLFGSVAMPCTCLYAMSREPGDLLQALRAGNSYISYLPQGPGVEADCAGRGLGEEAEPGEPVRLRFFRLRGGDEIRLITEDGCETIICPADTVEMALTRRYPGRKFCRFEVWRSYEHGLPPMYAMVSNPVYFRP